MPRYSAECIARAQYLGALRRVRAAAAASADWTNQGFGEPWYSGCAGPTYAEGGG